MSPLLAWRFAHGNPPYERGMRNLAEIPYAWTRELRHASGLVLFAYVFTHFINHACGLISIQAMDAVLAVNGGFWQSWLGRPLLYTSFMIHLSLALWALYRRDTFRMPASEATQLLLGFSIPFLAIQHVVNTRLGNMIYGAQLNYSWELTSFWVLKPFNAGVQTALLVVVWWHACIGLNYSLKLRPWYPRWRDRLLIATVTVPLLALLGFVEGGLRVAVLAQDPAWVAALKMQVKVPTPAQQADLFAVRNELWWMTLLIIAIALIARSIRRALRSRGHQVTLTYYSGQKVRITPGTSVLDASRQAGIAHASICGGRGRCTTCRVRVSDPDCGILPISEDEMRTLRRIGAAPDVRLACQFRPTRSITVAPLLPFATASARDGFARSAQFEGAEREIAILFADIRSFTQLSEHKLPYDVVFILNHYFAEMGAAVEKAGGKVDKFMGDGVMALFGLDGPPELACQQAMRSAKDMFSRLEGLNVSLAADLNEPLRIGVGVHCGHVIVGQMGHGTTLDLTAIGDAVNTASRLEALCKPYGCELVVSEDVSRRAGIDLSRFPLRELEIRGRDTQLAVYTLTRADLSSALSA
jgi:adenylate cyclase